jgi:hypothetical protein
LVKKRKKYNVAKIISGEEYRNISVAPFSKIGVMYSAHTAVKAENSK